MGSGPWLSETLLGEIPHGEPGTYVEIDAHADEGLDAALVDRGVARNSGKYCAQGHLMAALGFQDHRAVLCVRSVQVCATQRHGVRGGDADEAAIPDTLHSRVDEQVGCAVGIQVDDVERVVHRSILHHECNSIALVGDDFRRVEPVECHVAANRRDSVLTEVVHHDVIHVLKLTRPQHGVTHRRSTHMHTRTTYGNLLEVANRAQPAGSKCLQNAHARHLVIACLVDWRQWVRLRRTGLLSLQYATVVGVPPSNLLGHRSPAGAVEQTHCTDGEVAVQNLRNPQRGKREDGDNLAARQQPVHTCTLL